MRSGGPAERRTAPALYRGVRAVTREADGSLALGGQGAAIDWLVEMARFDQDTLFDRLAERGRLDLDMMAALASEVAQPVRGRGPERRPRRARRECPGACRRQRARLRGARDGCA